MKFSAVIPVFNEAESLETFQKELYEAMQKTSSDYEIIYVDDASTDSSLDILKKLAKNCEQIKIISFKENRGQSTALVAGFKQARGEWIITLDADLQNPPQEIPKLLRFSDKFDFITGVRRKREDSSLRKISSSIAKFFRLLILGDTTKDTGCSLRLFKREVVEQLPFFKNFHRFFTLLARRYGFKIKEVTVKHNVRKFGKSKYKTLKRTWEGIFDLIGVCWLKKRIINYEIKYKR